MQLKKRIEGTPSAQRKPGVLTCTGTSAPFKRGQSSAQGQAQAQAADPIDTNSTCQYAQNNYNGNIWYTRQDSCFVVGWNTMKVDPRTGAELGRIEGNAYYLNYVASGTTWGGQAKIVVNRVDPIMAGTSLSHSATCSGQCSASGGFGSQSISTVGTILRGTATYTMTGFTNSQGFGTTKWNGLVTYTNANPPTAPWDGSGNINGRYPPTVRCDTGARGVAGSGCVYNQYAPTLFYSRGIVGPLAQHIADAQASGLPGATDASPLTRLNSSIDDSNDNRDTACPASFPRPQDANGVTLDCDEYPFASSKQGASTSGVNGGGRTFSYCQIAPRLPIGVTGNGYSACMIDRSANRSGGGSLSAFYKSQRILWDDAFKVNITA